jgi:Ser/Thr protein kinase RdoA (MazF antagonist)
MGWSSLDLLDSKIAPEVHSRYLHAAEDILYELEECLQPESFIRIHGDCHKGNLLHRNDEFYFLDFDDFCNGPVAQDFWMLLGGELNDDNAELIEGYRELRDVSDRELSLFEPLRGLRIIHYAAWITKRWSDPSFPRLFPEFGTYSYWAEETEALEQIAWKINSQN